jgi:DNA primase
VTAIRDRSKVDAFARELAGMLGIDPNDVQREVRRAAARAGTTAAAPPSRLQQGDLPDPRDPRLTLERETLKLVVQRPQVSHQPVAEVTADDFTHPAYRAVWEAVGRAGGVPTFDDAQWGARLTAATDDERVRSLISALAVESLHSAKEPDQAYVVQHVSRLGELTVLRRIADLKSRLQRTNPVEQATDYNRMFGELVALEQHRRTLRERALEA